MSLVISTNETTQSQWMDIHTIKNLQCIVTNIFLKATRPVSLALNLPLRIYSCINAYQEQKYWKIAFDVASLVGLIGIGPLASILIDSASEAVKIYLKPKAPKLDCTMRANALMVMGLTEEAAQNKEIVDKRYADLSSAFTKRIIGACGSEPLLEKFKEMLHNVEIAYQTLR